MTLDNSVANTPFAIRSHLTIVGTFIRKMARPVGKPGGYRPLVWAFVGERQVL